jgi:ABC-type sugar transport system ATPase subunit
MTAAAGQPDVVLEAIGLAKSYGPVQACRDVDLQIRAGQMTAIVGDNGAGKSTIAKILTGAVAPDRGRLLVNGVEQNFTDPLQARLSGVEAVYQELALAPNLDVVHNIFLGRELVRSTLGVPFVPRLDENRMAAQAAEHMAQLAVNIPRLRGLPVGTMSGGQRQTVAIARAIFWASKVLVMDEPTAALGVRESRAVLDLVRTALDRGIAVVMISHIMAHVLELADHVAVMRHGTKVADLTRGTYDSDHLVRLIVGLETGERPPEVAVTPDPVDN